MTVQLNPYLGFPGSAREAMSFYQSVFGGDLVQNTFGESGGSDDPSEKDKIMHSMLTTEGGLTLMGADAANGMDYTPGTNYSVSLSGEDEAELQQYWTSLSEGGSVDVPLERAPWGDSFGMCTDRFGVRWMVNITAPQS